MITAFIQARMGSSRLPGKVMKQVLGIPLIGHMINRLKQSETLERIVIVTSTNPENDPLCEYVKQQGVDVFRGSEDNVLDRFYQAFCVYRPRIIVRMTADCPLIDYKVVDKVIRFFLDHSYDYVANAANYPVYPDGQDVEVFYAAALETAWKEATLLSEKEHVTPYIRKSGKFKLGDVPADRDYQTERWTVDQEEDFILVKTIIENLGQNGRYFDMKEILEFHARNPKFFEVNQHIIRNEGYLKSLKKDKEQKTCL